MELHSDEGTQRLELPVSRTTLKSCGGVPREISEKSNGVSRWLELWRTSNRERRTLSVQEVADGHWVRAVSHVGRLEHLLGMVLRLDAHVLLTERLCVLLDVCVFLRVVRFEGHGDVAMLLTYQLLRQRHLLELHLVNAGNGG